MPHMPVLSYETIADDLIVCTSQLHRFGTDAVLLTEFSEYRQKDRVCDLGTGCGIIPILMQRTAPPPGDLRRRHSAGGDRTDVPGHRRKHGHRFSPAPGLHRSERTLGRRTPGAAGSGHLQSALQGIPGRHRKPADGTNNARHEVLCNIYDICRSAKRLLRFGGRLCICNRPERWQTAWMPCGKTASNQSGCSLWRKRRTHSRGCSCWRAEAAAILF